MRGKSGTGGLNVGGSSILVIFVLLCLTTFATLAMVSARADYRLAQRAAQSTTNYYAADSRAEEILAEIHMGLAAISHHPPEGPHIERMLERLSHECRFHSAPDGEFIYYEVPIDDALSLAVTLELNHTDRTRLNIVEWRVIVTAPFDSFGEDAFDLFIPN